MIEIFGEVWTTTLFGAAGGIILGLAARLGRFCTLGAIEDLLYGGSDIRIRMWGLAIGIAIMGCFGLSIMGIMEPHTSYYLSIRWMPLASILGGGVFGYGMALAGNCGYGAIARLGGGDFRAFVVVLVMGISAYATLAGPLAPLRNWAFPQIDVTSDLPPGLAHYLGWHLQVAPDVIGISIGVFVTGVALASREVWRKPQALFWGTSVGLAITSGWAGSYYAATAGFADLPVVSHSFSAPVGETLLYLMTASVREPSFAVGSITGVALGAFVGSLIKGHFRWEACEDPRELRRQIIGAALMGIGAVLALGCTVGQGMTAFSTLAWSAPVTFAALFAGAALGLRQLIEGFQAAA
jgi:uncharacterized membrane protein YedE/YeeE